MEDNIKIIKEKKYAKRMIIFGILLFIFGLFLPVVTYIYGYISGMLDDNESGFGWLIVIELWIVPFFLVNGAVLFFLGIDKNRKCKKKIGE